MSCNIWEEFPKLVSLFLLHYSKTSGIWFQWSSSYSGTGSLHLIKMWGMVLKDIFCIKTVQERRLNDQDCKTLNCLEISHSTQRKDYNSFPAASLPPAEASSAQNKIWSKGSSMKRMAVEAKWPYCYRLWGAGKYTLIGPFPGLNLQRLCASKDSWNFSFIIFNGLSTKPKQFF